MEENENIKEKQNLETIEGEEPYNYFNSKSILLTFFTTIPGLIYGFVMSLIGIFFYYGNNQGLVSQSEVIFRYGSLILYIYSVVLLFVGLILPNREAKDFYKKSHYKESKLPLSVKNEIKRIRYPLVVSFLFVLMFGLIVEFINILVFKIL